MSMRFTVLAGILLGSAAAAGAPAGMTGESDVAAVVGNGRLTCGISPRAQLVHFRWPSPGLADHLDYLVLPDGTHKPNSGAMWAVELDGRVVWLSMDPELTAEWAPGDGGIQRVRLRDERAPPDALDGGDGGIAYEMTAFVPPGLDVLVLRLLCAGAAKPPRVFWYGNFAPCTRIIATAPVSDWLLDPWNDFAAFTLDDRRAIIHFHPQNPTGGERERLARVAPEERRAAEWSTFTDGVYVAYGSEGDAAATHVGKEASPAAAFSAVNRGTLLGHTAAVGACDSAMELVPARQAEGYVAVIYVAAASTADQAISALNRARTAGFDRLAADTTDVWRRWLEKAQLPEALPATVRDRCLRALTLIHMNTDARSGAIVRSSRTQPPYALNWPRYAAWINLALDVCGYHDEAWRNLECLLRTVRTEGDASLRGSMPAAVYADGTPAFPGFVRDVDNVGWLLWSVFQHGQMLPVEQQSAVFESAWTPVAHAAEFLVSWADARDGAPLHSFDWRSLHDAQRDQTAQVVFLGMEAAVRIAAALGREVPPSWLRRRNELDVLTRLRMLHQDSTPLPDEAVIFWLTERMRRPRGEPLLPGAQGIGRRILDPQDPRWLEFARRALEQSPRTAETLLSAAWLTSEFPNPHVTVAELGNLDIRFTDALDAAYFILAAVAAPEEGALIPPRNGPS